MILPSIGVAVHPPLHNNMFHRWIYWLTSYLDRLRRVFLKSQGEQWLDRENLDQIDNGHAHPTLIPISIAP